MTLDEHLSLMYRAEVLHKGSPEAALASLRGAISIDQSLYDEAAERLAALQTVLAARPKDYTTQKQVTYLQRALTQ